MLQAEVNPSPTPQSKKRPDGVSVATPSSRCATFVATGRACFLITLCVALPLVFARTAFAQESEQMGKVSGCTLPTSAAAEVNSSAFHTINLPSLDSIGPQTDISIFLRSGVPDRLRVAALRRTWTVDPAIRDFKGLQESDWDFNDPNSILGFGELGPEIDVKTMVAQVFGETPQEVARVPEPKTALFTRVMLRLF